MPTPRQFSALNLFVPSATGQVIAYIRKPGQFKLMDYAQLVKSGGTDQSGKPVCFFCTIDPDHPARVVTDQEFAWEIGDDPPEGSGMLPNFTTTEVRMFLRAIPYRLAETVVDNAEFFKPLNVYREMALMQAMTLKTYRVWTLLDNATNWGVNTADANALNGGRGKWSTASATEGSPFYLAIKRSLTAAVKKVQLATNSIVQDSDLRCVISPDLAEAGGNSGEITDYLKGGPFSKMQQEGVERGKNSKYGMPDYYAGVQIIVEDASRVSDRVSAAGTASTTGRSFIKGATNAVLLSRKGGLDGVEGSPSWSTLQIYYHKYEMSVEERHDEWKKRHDGRVLDWYKEVLANNRSGYDITNCL